MNFLKLWTAVIYISIGVLIGGFLFSRSQPRSVFALNNCRECMTSKDFAGLLVSTGINRLPGLIPKVELETEKSIVIKNPFKERNFGIRGKTVDYLIFPKKDIKNIAEISTEDAQYLADALLAARQIIEKHGSTDYRLITNGPGFQDINYLHFHLLVKVAEANRKDS